MVTTLLGKGNRPGKERNERTNERSRKLKPAKQNTVTHGQIKRVCTDIREIDFRIFGASVKARNQPLVAVVEIEKENGSNASLLVFLELLS